jgi:16S rRNA processing protein RimM
VSERVIPLGEIVTTHGLGGWLKLKPYNSQTDVPSPEREIFLEKDGIRSAHRIESSRRHKGQLLIKLLGVDLIGDAEPFIGATLGVAEATLQTLQPGEYYHYQVIGLEVFDLRGQRIGTITRTWSTPGAELYVVAGTSKEHLIPAVKEIIERVDLNAGRMIVNLPEGLLDL